MSRQVSVAPGQQTAAATSTLDLAGRAAPLRGWELPLLLGLALAALTAIPYAVAYATQAPGHVFMGFFFLGDDANTYLAKMRQGWEGNWIWHNRYTTEPGPGAYFFVWWIALGHLAAALHIPLLATFHAARVIGAVALLGWSWSFIKHCIATAAPRRFALWFFAVGLGMGYVVQALGKPVILGLQSDTLDWRMPELSAFYSILALPHFVWAAAFQAVACVLSLRALSRGSIRLAVLAGLAWLAESSIHAQMPVLLGGALLAAALVRPLPLRGWMVLAIALAIPAPYVGYSYWQSLHSPEVLRWSQQWRNNLPPEGLSLVLALAPQLVLAVLAVPGAIRRRSREDVFLVAWLVLLAGVLWLPSPAASLRRRFFDGVSLPLVVLGARGLYEVVLPRLPGLRARRLLPFAYVSFSAIGSLFLLAAPMFNTQTPAYSLTRGEVQGLAWLASQPPGAVLSTERMGLYVPAYSPDSVYVGQYSETYLYFEKAKEAGGLLAGEGDAGTFSREHGLRYVFWSSAAGAPGPHGLGEPAFNQAGVRIWRVPGS